MLSTTASKCIHLVESHQAYMLTRYAKVSALNLRAAWMISRSKITPREDIITYRRTWYYSTHQSPSSYRMSLSRSHLFFPSRHFGLHSTESHSLASSGFSSPSCPFPFSSLLVIIWDSIFYHFLILVCFLFLTSLPPHLPPHRPHSSRGQEATSLPRRARILDAIFLTTYPNYR